MTLRSRGKEFSQDRDGFASRRWDENRGPNVPGGLSARPDDLDFSRGIARLPGALKHTCAERGPSEMEQIRFRCRYPRLGRRSLLAERAVSVQPNARLLVLGALVLKEHPGTSLAGPFA